ncbi:MAG TPA: alpha/beta fold hydrolase [Candidatus Limnocylindrales bacterium]|nr:alpha/beta fold hydrolase [Candidatus Limnocylindrales bacterium]
MRIHGAGNPRGSPLVLIHGLSSSHRCWDRNLAALGADHHVRLVELFPRGRRGMRFDLSETAQHLRRMLEAGPAPVSVIGHSMGGLIALHLADQAPELVDRLVLAAAPVGRRSRSLLGQLGGVVMSGTRTDLQSVSLVMGTLLAAGPMRMAAATHATLRADLAGEAAALGMPTLLVWGDDDRLVPVEVGRRLAQLVPNARLVTIAMAGHQAMWEAPEAFNAAVLSFLTGNPTPR